MVASHLPEECGETEETMETVATCICGYQGWTLLADRMMCDACKAMYNYPTRDFARDFNEQKDDLMIVYPHKEPASGGGGVDG